MTVPAHAEPPRVSTGAGRLAADGFARLAGRRIGLVTNHTGRVGTEHVVDMMRAAGVRIAAVLSPEHGFRGTAEAGAQVHGGIDPSTGIPIVSLYGPAGRKPAPDLLARAGIDMLVFDIQDIGVRYYTYISTMALTMQAAAEARLPYLVLDRPNPLGGVDVAGFMLEPALRSFVGQVAIPQIHGLTVAELARMIKGERLMTGLDKLDLDVVAMTGWRRDMRWPETGLEWLATSPNIPSVDTALAYAGTGLFEATEASDGRGTRHPFLLLGATWSDAHRLVARMTAAELPGVTMTAVRFRPRPIPGMASDPRLAGLDLGGVRLTVADHSSYRPLETGVHLLAAFAAEARAHGGATALVTRNRAFDQMAGSPRLRTMLAGDQAAPLIIAAWQPGVAAFKARRTAYLMY